MKVLPRKCFGSKINAIIEATIDLKKLVLNQIVYKLRAYKVANEIA